MTTTQDADLELAVDQDGSGQATFIPPALPPEDVRPRAVGGIRLGDVAALIGSALVGLALTSLVFREIAPLSGTLGFIVCTYVTFVATYAVVLSLDNTFAVIKDRLAALVVHSLAALLLLALVVVIGYTVWRGRLALVHSNFYREDLSVTGPQQPLSVGGVAHAAIGTLIMISIALVITIPLGLSCAVFLSEIPGRFSRFVRTIVEAMTALPSIVAGLFIYAALIVGIGGSGGLLPPSGFAASLAISIMMLPIIIRSADVVLRLVPGTLKEASYAAGASQWRTVWHVVLPTVRSGLATAVILATARGIGETSPVLLTAGFTTRFNFNPFHGPMVSLPLATFDLVRKPSDTMVDRGFGAATMLFFLVLVLFVTARLIGGSGPGQLSPRQRRRAKRRSARDAKRFELWTKSREAHQDPTSAVHLGPDVTSSTAD
jgi:phosphate transport system permease protein